MYQKIKSVTIVNSLMITTLPLVASLSLVRPTRGKLLFFFYYNTFSKQSPTLNVFWHPSRDSFVSHSLNLLFHEKFLNALVEVNSTNAGTLGQQKEYFPLRIASYDKTPIQALFEAILYSRKISLQLPLRGF